LGGAWAGVDVEFRHGEFAAMFGSGLLEDGRDGVARSATLSPSFLLILDMTAADVSKVSVMQRCCEGG
jgi:hypothetical protein